MKKKIQIMVCALVLLSLSACDSSTNNEKKEPPVTEQSISTEGTIILEITSAFDSVQNIGTVLFDCFEGFDC